MSPIEHIATCLKEARERKGLSQRALSIKTGLTQSQISRIENGAVDLQASTLITLARALDLEPMLIPRRLVPAIQGLVRPTRESPRDDKSAHPFTPAYHLDEGDDHV